MRTPLFILGLLIISLIIVQGANATIVTDAHGVAGWTSTGGATAKAGVNITMTTAGYRIINVTKEASCTATTAYIDSGTASVVSESASFVGNVATFNSVNVLPTTGYFSVRADNGGSAYTNRYSTTFASTITKTVSNYNYPNQYSITGYNRLDCIVSITYDNSTIPVTITAKLSNLVNGSLWSSNVSFSNVTGALTFSYFNITDTGYCVTYTGNGTGTNCTAGNGASAYYNVSNTTTITATKTVTTGTYQALINVTAKQLFTNSSIGSFNVMNAFATNTTTGSSLLVPANNGSNNVKIDVAGNYSLNATCTGASLSVSSCVITGIYDNLFTIGGKNGTSGVSTFSVTVSNSTLGSTSGSTTNGSYVFPLLQGYYYNFQMNASGYALDNETLAANASTNLYNFTLYTMNTFNLVFRNESTNTILSGQNITVQLISDTFSNNYTTSNGLLNVSLLTPDAYTIRYWLDSSVPRDYYTTLTPQSIQDLDLYVLDAGISSLYLPIIKDQNGRAISDATVKLLRYYILSSNTGEYETVEMSKTDTNGQAVLRVVPNIINYKLIITKDGKTLTTTPTKFTSTTNTYTLNTQSSPLTSIANIEGVSQSLTYNSGTQTFVFTWNDDNGIVSSGCLKVTKFSNTITEVMDECENGAAGSLIYTINDTNQTQYKAQSTINTNTPYSSYSDIIDMDFRTKYQVWGTIGLFLTLIVFLTFSFMGAGNTETTVMYGVGAIFLMGAFGVIFGNYQSIIGIIIIAGIIIYKTRT